VRIQFLGATGTVTGSKYLVTSGGASVLVDCGLFQGFKELRLRNWAPPPFDPSRVDCVILTHAHIDHSGYLPLMVKRGFGGRIYCSDATLDLCRILLPDSAHLQEEQAEHANRFGYSKHSPALPLYTRADAARALRRFAPVTMGREWQPVPGMAATLLPAGHILGASMLCLGIASRTLAFSGDLGRDHDPILRPPSWLKSADALVLESTYGDRVHGNDDPEALLGDIVARTAARGGTVVIPAFAVGRAQSLLYYLERLKAAHRIPAQLRIYVDSPMATDVTAVYLHHPALHRLTHEHCERLRHVARHVASVEESRSLDQSAWPMVIIAGSGMATGGRVLHHLKRFAPDPRNTIVFAGFQAGGTRGEAIVHGAREVKIQGEYVPVRAEVRHLDMLSAHADRDEIVRWLENFRRTPGRVFLTHGEPNAAESLRRHIAEKLGWTCEVPAYLDTVDL
jgi:metallo-beta-lactamase family protein